MVPIDDRMIACEESLFGWCVGSPPHRLKDEAGVHRETQSLFSSVSECEGSMSVCEGPIWKRRMSALRSALEDVI